MSFVKTPITALHEYCAKKNVDRPVYEIFPSEDGSKSFICVVEAFKEIAEGVGRSKKEAQHDAAAKIIKRLKNSYTDIEEIPHASIPTRDTVADLRDLCLQLDHPFPQFEIVHQAGPPEAPEFTAECKIGSIVQYATASTKKAAKQLVAEKLLNIINKINGFNAQNQDLQLVELEELQNIVKAEKQRKIKTYREYIESEIKEPPGTLLCDRHKYFEKFDPAVKAKAFEIIKDENIINEKEKVDYLLKTLEIPYKVSTIPSSSSTMIKFIELQCDIDTVFSNTEEKIYNEIIRYFKIMLL